MRTSFSVLGGAVLCLPTVLPSHAQSPAQSQSTLGEVVVTATRRETTLQDTPLAISAFDQATLDENRVVSLLDVRGLVPNLQFFENGDHAVPLIFIRGLGTRNQTEAGDQGIAFYSDGVFAARSQGTTVMLYDLDRIEVLRGPQGTLFGRNATGGAIAVHTAKPDASGFDASGEIVSGSDSLLGFRGMVNIPIGDKWALRAAGAARSRTGARPSPRATSSRPTASTARSDLSSYRISSMFQPTENVSWFLAFENFRNQGTGDVGSMDFDNRVNDATAPGNLDLDSDSLRTRLDVGVGGGYTLSYIGGYAEFDQSQLYGNGVQGDSRNTVFSTYEGTQHELQLTSPHGPAAVLDCGTLLFRGREQHPLRHAARQLGLHAAGFPGRRAVHLRPAEPRARVRERVRRRARSRSPTVSA